MKTGFIILLIFPCTLFVMQTSAEFTELMMCVQEYAPQNLTEKLLSDKRFHGKVSEFKAKAGVTLPEAVDWRTGGAVTKIKDQVSYFHAEGMLLSI